MLVAPSAAEVLVSWQEYQDNCPGCQPAMIDCQTGQRLSRRHPAMRAIRIWWKTVPLSDKRAWHEFTCQNSREPQIMAVMERLREKIQQLMDKAK